MKLNPLSDNRTKWPDTVFDHFERVNLEGFHHVQKLGNYINANLTKY